MNLRQQQQLWSMLSMKPRRIRHPTCHPVWARKNVGKKVVSGSKKAAVMSKVVSIEVNLVSLVSITVNI